MQYEIAHRPEFSMLAVHMNQGESVVAESGAMVAMTPQVDIKTSARGGVWKALKRAVVGGESIFQNTFTATADGQHVKFSPPTMGDLVQYDLQGSMLLLQSRAYVASAPEVTLDTKWEGFKGFFSGNGLFLLKVEGTGPVFFSTYGAVQPIQVDGSMVVDTGHIVAFEPSLQYRVKSVGGMKSLFFSGEGLVAEFSGQGRVWMQTRRPSRLAEFLHPYRRVESSSSGD